MPSSPRRPLALSGAERNPLHGVGCPPPKPEQALHSDKQSPPTAQENKGKMDGRLGMFADTTPDVALPASTKPSPPTRTQNVKWADVGCHRTNTFSLYQNSPHCSARGSRGGGWGAGLQELLARPPDAAHPAHGAASFSLTGRRPNRCTQWAGDRGQRQAQYLTRTPSPLPSPVTPPTGQVTGRVRN